MSDCEQHYLSITSLQKQRKRSVGFQFLLTVISAFALSLKFIHPVLYKSPSVVITEFAHVYINSRNSLPVCLCSIFEIELGLLRLSTGHAFSSKLDTIILFSSCWTHDVAFIDCINTAAAAAAYVYTGIRYLHPQKRVHRDEGTGRYHDACARLSIQYIRSLRFHLFL